VVLILGRRHGLDGSRTNRLRRRLPRPGAPPDLSVSRHGAERKGARVLSRGLGVDQLRVNYTSSGNLIRFSYRVVEPKLAKATRRP